MKIALLNHGCSKNLIDSELMLGMLIQAGYKITLDEDEADVVIVNTCSFIHDAEKESVQSVLSVIMKNKKVIIAGCLAQKHKNELKKALPEVRALVGTSNIDKIVETVKKVVNTDEFTCLIAKKPKYCYPESVERQQITVGASSYLKIAEGCNFKCGYCIIPELKGPFVSRKIQDITAEASKMAQKGVREIVIVAQDTTSYGIDIYKKPSLARLLKELNKIDGLDWIRVMYTYPSLIDDELIETIAGCEKVVKYLDIPLQHSHPEVLRNMKRPITDYKSLIKKIRAKIPEISLRTTFITGYPNETQEQFQHLYDFIAEMRFDKLGVFEFCSEKGTYAATLKNKIHYRTKRKRKELLMQLQQEISSSVNKSLIGKKIPCIVETVSPNGQITARSYRDAPEIDGVVYITSSKSLLPADIVHVKITNADEYDLYGHV